MNKQSEQLPENFQRRQLLVGSAAVAASLATTGVLAGDHKHHDHGTSKHNELIETALDCVKTGEACAHHCLIVIKDGDTSIVDCLDSVNQMLPMVSTLTTLASAHSKHLYNFAQVCAAVCKDCEKECEMHADKHPECKLCMESCIECREECEKLTA